MDYPATINDLSRLCIHTQTTRPWDLRQCIENYAGSGIHRISVWRHLLENTDPKGIRRILKDHAMEVVSLVRGGFFASSHPGQREAAIADNLEAIREAEALGAPVLVVVCGADPGQSPVESVDQIREGIASVLPAASEVGVRLAIEPLHPMYAAGRSAIVTMKQANDLAESLDSDLVGVAVDVFHVWWDVELEREIGRCGAAGKLFAFHLSDWKTEMTDLLNDRGLMGEGCIDLKRIRGWMEQAGFEGSHEVEIFSNRYWKGNQGEFVRKICDAYLKHA